MHPAALNRPPQFMSQSDLEVAANVLESHAMHKVPPLGGLHNTMVD